MPNHPANSAESRVVSEGAKATHKVQAGSQFPGGGLGASYLTEPVHLRLGDHQETIWFMVAPKMAEEVILGLP